MDRASVVREQLDGGERLIRRLVASGFNLAGGLWTQAEGDGQVYLYLITPEVEGRDPRIAYGKLAATQKAIEQEGVHWLERIEAFGPQNWKSGKVPSFSCSSWRRAAGWV